LSEGKGEINSSSSSSVVGGGTMEWIGGG